MNLGTLPDFVKNPDPSIYLTGKYLVLDFENTNLEKGYAGRMDNRIVFTAWKCSWKKNIDISWKDEFHLDNLLEDLEKADFLVSQNCKYELGWLKRCGVELNKILVYDTMLGHYNLAGNRRWRYNLNELVDFYKVGRPKNKLEKLLMKYVCPSEWPKSWLKNYCINDVLTEEKIFLKQRELLHNMGLLPTLYTKCLFSPVLTEIELIGMFVDPELVTKEYIKVKKELEQKSEKLHMLTGGINFRSSKQLREFLYNILKFKPVLKYGEPITTGKGELPTSEGIINSLKSTNKRQKEFLEYYKSAKKLTSSMSKILEQLYKSSLDTGLIHANYSQITTQTHRLASTKRNNSVFYSIQLQNIPRKYKPLFKSRYKDWKIIEVDEAGFEFRAAAQLANDKQAIKDILDPNFDPHVFSANEVFDLRLTKFTKDQVSSQVRQDAKSETFGPLYGKSTGSPAQLRWIAAFRKRYNKIYKMHCEWEEEVLSTGQLILPTGLRFYWPDYDKSYSIKTGKYWLFPQVCDYGVQNFATAEGTPLAIICQWHRMKSLDMQSFLVNSVHDSTIAECPNEEVEQFQQVAKQAFTEDIYHMFRELYSIEMVLPLEAEITVRKNWNAPLDKSGKEVINFD